MNKLQDDIARYRNGTLTPAERHALEKRALDDPFLADALEGAERIPAIDFDADVKALNKKITEGKSIRWSLSWRLAAAFIGMAFLATITYINLQPDTSSIAASNKSVSETNKSIDSTRATIGDSIIQPTAAKPVDQLTASAQTETKQADPTEEDKPTVKPNLNTQQNLAIAKQKPDAIAATNNSSNTASITKTDSAIITVSDEARIAVAEPTPALVELKNELVLERAKQSEAAHTNVVVITGQVRDQSGQPMPGVNVITKGSVQGSVTDAEGKYAIELPAHTGTLEFSFIGYVTQAMTIDKTTQYADVQLLEDATQLSEVVVTGYGEKRTDGEPIVRLAEPVGGRKAYDQYLENNKIYPQQALDNKIEGKVVIEFSISASGTLSDFQVIRKLGFGCDEEVIRLVKEGPSWQPSYIDNEPVESLVRVKTRFSIPKKGR